MLVAPPTPVQMDLFPPALDDDGSGPWPCDRCGLERADLSRPHPGSLVLWCGPCREASAACHCCDTPVDFSILFCPECANYEPAFGPGDHFGDDR